MPISLLKKFVRIRPSIACPDLHQRRTRQQQRSVLKNLEGRNELGRRTSCRFGWLEEKGRGNQSRTTLVASVLSSRGDSGDLPKQQSVPTLPFPKPSVLLLCVMLMLTLTMTMECQIFITMSKRSGANALFPIFSFISVCLSVCFFFDPFFLSIRSVGSLRRGSR